MRILIIVEIPEIEDVESQQAENALMIITDSMIDFPYSWYVDEVIQDEPV
jgi:hypothetical protein